MCNTIRQEIREYIIEDINRSLNRLGIFEPLYEYNSKPEGYYVRTNSIRQMPVVFDELWIDGLISVNAPKGEFNYVVVGLRFKYTLLNNRGSNGHELGSVCYRVPKELPDDLSTEKAFGFMNRIVRKEKGLL